MDAGNEWRRGTRHHRLLLLLGVSCASFHVSSQLTSLPQCEREFLDGISDLRVGTEVDGSRTRPATVRTMQSAKGRECGNSREGVRAAFSNVCRLERQLEARRYRAGLSVLSLRAPHGEGSGRGRIRGCGLGRGTGRAQIVNARVCDLTRE